MSRQSKLTVIEKIALSQLEESNITLTEKEEDFLKRWNFVYHKRLAFENETTIVQLLIQEFGISTGTAYNDLKKSTQLYPNSYTDNKKALKSLNHDIILKGLKMAEEEKDLSAYARLAKEFRELHRTDQEDREIPTEDKIQVKEIAIDFIPEDFKEGLPDHNQLMAKIEKLSKPRERNGSLNNLEAEDATIVNE